MADEPKQPGDKELQALHDAVRHIASRVETLQGRAGDDGVDKRYPDAKRRDDAPLSAGEIRSMMRVLQRHLAELEPEGEDDQFGDDRRDRRRKAHDAPAHGEPRELAADDDDEPRRAARHDSARDALDLELNDLATEQQEWGKVYMAHGERAQRPMHGETLLSFVRRNARHYQHTSDRWRDKNLRTMPRDVLLDIAAPEIRKDALAAAYRPDPNVAPVLREVIRTDRTGRRISEFVGPVSVFLDQFRAPAMMVRCFNIGYREDGTPFVPPIGSTR
jgi:hypothetical protein